MVSTVQLLLLSAVCLPALIVEGKTVFYEGFTKSLNVNKTGSSYVYFTRKTAVANDGKLVLNSNKTLTQDVRPFKVTTPLGPGGITDHFKQIVLHKTYWSVTTKQVLTCELKTWSKQTGVSKQPFGKAVTDPFDDVRLSTCGLYVGDPQTFTLAHFLQSVSSRDKSLTTYQTPS